MALITDQNMPIKPHQRIAALATDLYNKLSALRQGVNNSLEALDSKIDGVETWADNRFSELIADRQSDSASVNARIDALPAQFDARIESIVGAAPAALDTIGELAVQLANEGNAVAALTNTVAGKVGNAAFSQLADAFDALERDYSIEVQGNDLIGSVNALDQRVSAIEVLLQQLVATDYVQP